MHLWTKLILCFYSQEPSLACQICIWHCAYSSLLHPRGKERILNGKNLQPFPNIIVDFA